MDRRNLQAIPNAGIYQKNCIHTKNVFSLIDLSSEDETYKKIKRHTDACQICETELKKFELKNLEARIHIPKPQIDLETKAVYEREVSDLFKVFDLNEKELIRKKIKKKIKTIDMAGIDFIKNLTSKNMFKTYAFGLVLFVVLRRFFN